MKKEFLVGLIAVLAGALIFETAYLLGSRQTLVSKRPVARHHKPLPKDKFLDSDLAFLDRMRFRDPFLEMEQMQQSMQRAFENNLSRQIRAKGAANKELFFAPSISINATENAYLVKADLPGVDKKSINVEVKDRLLIISGERKQEESKEDKGLYRQELSYGSFLRSLALPDDAKINQITSQYKDGVLTVTIPREKTTKTTEQPKVKIPVQ